MVRPLTKRDPDGVLYARPSTIETAITVATQQDLDCLGRRAWVEVISMVDDSSSWD
jgi:hypothetical protein